MENNMLFNLLAAILYGIVEGITEWLPISSTGHLILLEEFLPFRISSTFGVELVAEFFEMFGVVIQLGAILAVVVLYFKKLNPLARSKSAPEKKATISLWCHILVASIPAALMGIVGDKILEKLSGKDIDGWLYNAYVVAAALIIYGVLFIVIEKLNKNKSYEVLDVADISYKKAFFIGIFQMLAMIPGTSRSGSTILGSMCLGLSRSAAAEFSFFMAIPVMAGASAVKLLGFFEHVFETGVSVPLDMWLILAVGFAVAFFVSLAAIKFLTDFVKRHSFSAFGVYRIALGVLVFLWFCVVKQWIGLR